MLRREWAMRPMQIRTHLPPRQAQATHGWAADEAEVTRAASAALASAEAALKRVAEEPQSAAGANAADFGSDSGFA